MAYDTGFQRTDVRVALGTSLLTWLFMWWLWYSGAKHEWARPLAFLFFMAWSVGPPLYFLFQWTRFENGKDFDGNAEKLKYSQDLASKYWLAGVTVLSAAIIGSFGGPDATFARSDAQTKQPVIVNVTVEPPASGGRTTARVP